MPIHKTWFEDGKLITELYSDNKIYKPNWVDLTYDEQEEIVLSAHSIRDAINKTNWKLKEKNNG